MNVPRGVQLAGSDVPLSSTRLAVPLSSARLAVPSTHSSDLITIQSFSEWRTRGTLLIRSNSTSMVHFYFSLIFCIFEKEC